MLYQLSYSRLLHPKINPEKDQGFWPFLPVFPLMNASGESRIRTYEGISQQIYSLPQLTALVSPRLQREPMKGLEPPTG